MYLTAGSFPRVLLHWNSADRLSDAPPPLPTPVSLLSPLPERGKPPLRFQTPGQPASCRTSRNSRSSWARTGRVSARPSGPPLARCATRRKLNVTLTYVMLSWMNDCTRQRRDSDDSPRLMCRLPAPVTSSSSRCRCWGWRSSPDAVWVPVKEHGGTQWNITYYVSYCPPFWR